MLIVSPECGEAILRRHEAHSAGLGQLIVGGTGGIEAILKGNHLPQQIQVLKSSILHRALRHAPKIIIMPGVARWDLTVGAKGLLVKDRDLFPEGALRRHCAKRGAGLLKHLWILLGGKGRDRGLLRWCPGGQCTDLQPDNRENGALRKQARVGKADCLRIGWVNADLKIVIQQRTEILLLLGDNYIREKDLRPGIDRFVKLVLLILAALSPGLVLPTAHQSPVKDQVNVLGKAVDQIKALGQAGAALKGQMFLP